MHSDNDLKYYLQHWKEFYSSDVEGQTDSGQHLDDKKLAELAQASAAQNAAGDPTFEHLSTCPLCLERWAHFCRESAPEVGAGPDHATLAFGSSDEDDVSGQSAGQQLSSSCGRFILELVPSDLNPDRCTVSLRTTAVDFADRHLQVREKSGRLLLDGKLTGQQLSAEISDCEQCDLSVWTVIASE